jgi:hypothetical protein
MRKTLIGCVGVVVLVLAGLAATPTFAASELLGNTEVIKELAAQITGSILLEDEKATGKPDFLCEYILDVLLVNGTLTFIEQVLMSNGELLAATVNNLEKAVEGDDLECTDDSGICSAPVLVVAINLPWHVELELISELYKLHFLSGTEEAGKEPGYNVDCNSILGLVEDICEGLVFAEMVAETGGVLMKFNSLKELSCTQGGAASVNLVGEGLLEETGVTFSLN